MSEPCSFKFQAAGAGAESKLWTLTGFAFTAVVLLHPQAGSGAAQVVMIAVDGAGVDALHFCSCPAPCRC